MESNRTLAALGVAGLTAFGFAAPPGIPAERGAALRLGFDRMVKDKAFLDDIKKRKILINPMSGDQLQKVVVEVMATDAALAKKLKWATTP